MLESQVAVTMGKAGALLPVRVKPRGRANVIEGARHGFLLISVTAPPVAGAANAAVIEVVAAALGCAKSRVHIERGHKSREKIVGVAGFSAQDVFDRLTTDSRST